jgi:hypothetical protein
MWVCPCLLFECGLALGRLAQRLQLLLLTHTAIDNTHKRGQRQARIPIVTGRQWAWQIMTRKYPYSWDLDPRSIGEWPVPWRRVVVPARRSPYCDSPTPTPTCTPITRKAQGHRGGHRGGGCSVMIEGRRRAKRGRLSVVNGFCSSRLLHVR